jgi:hypothetical protein
MTIKAISHSYWRAIKAGTRTFESVANSSKAAIYERADEIRYLAKADVQSGVITAEEYAEYIGETYEEA